MKIPKETPEKHSCLHCYGKATHIETDNYGIYCAYCHQILLRTQINKRWERLIR